MFRIVLLAYLSHGVCVSYESAPRPHIIYILADDLGWNDVGFHGSNQIPTPNIDALAYSGIILNNYYVTPICTPSRSALMTGKYPIHTGMQHAVLYGAEPRGLPLSEKLLPEYLKELGYSTHLVGKWHLGSYKKVYTPLYRGFDSHVGFWTGRIDYFDHTSEEFGTWGFDFRRGMEVAYDLFGKYATDVYTEEAVKIIKNHNTSTPLYLMIAHSAVHSGNPYSPLPAPDDTVARFHNIDNYPRQRFAGMLSELDKSVGEIVSALHKHGLLRDSIIVFATDNGGPAAGFNNNAASNYPLRGVKNTLWEGGVRGAALLWSSALPEKSRVSDQMMHIADWLPTLYTAAGGDVKVMKNIDGVDMWESLKKNLPSARTSVLHNIDDIYGSAAITVEQWKLHKGTNYGGVWDSWYGPSGREGNYDVDALYKHPAGKALTALNLMPDNNTITQLRESATVECISDVKPVPCKPLISPCLFDVKNDPCERINLAEKQPNVVQRLLSLLEKFNKTSVPPGNVPLSARGDPRLWGHVYTNFGDHPDSTTTLATDSR